MKFSDNYRFPFVTTGISLLIFSKLGEAEGSGTKDVSRSTVMSAKLSGSKSSDFIL